jgi:ribosomal protein L11 methyltransferase
MSRTVPSEAAAAWRTSIVVNAAIGDAVQTAFDDHFASVAAFEIEEGGDWIIEGIDRNPPDEAALRSRLALVAAMIDVPLPDPMVEKVPPTDWLAATYQAFPPLRIGRFFIHGSHIEDGPPAGSIPLCIDAATAFGSGEHPTTEGCLRALDRLSRRRRFHRILDMGCGTGILSFAAARLFGAPVLSADIDPESIRVTRINARINRLADPITAVVSNGYASRVVRENGPYDLIIANILARPLMSMAADLRRNLAPGGMVILAGLLERQAPQVLAAHRLQRLTLADKIPIRGWPTLVLH